MEEHIMKTSKSIGYEQVSVSPSGWGWMTLRQGDGVCSLSHNNQSSSVALSLIPVKYLAV